MSERQLDTSLRCKLKYPYLAVAVSSRVLASVGAAPLSGLHAGIKMGPKRGGARGRGFIVIDVVRGSSGRPILLGGPLPQLLALSKCPHQHDH